MNTPVSTPLVEVSFMLPKLNSSRKFNAMLFHELNNLLAAKFGGWTRESVTGGWNAGDGDLLVERNYRYTVAVPDDDRSVARVIRTAIRCAKMLNQAVCYVKVKGVVWLYPIPTEG